MEEKLIIKTEEGPLAIGCVIGAIALFIWLWMEGNKRVNAEGRLPKNIVAMLLIAVCIYIMIIFLMMYAKKMELTKNGCVISILFIKKFYPWEEYRVKRRERFHKNKWGRKYMIVYDEGVIFSRKPLKVINMKKCWEARFAWRQRAFSTVWFCFQTEESLRISGEKLDYNADKDLFFRKMEEWGIELDPEVDEWIG